LFQTIYDLLDEGALSTLESRHAGELLSWFDTNLQKPTSFSRKRNDNHRDRRGVAWFKDSAAEHINRIRVLAQIVEQHGIAVEMIQTARPGYVVYEDDDQIVAEPFIETAGRGGL